MIVFPAQIDTIRTLPLIVDGITPISATVINNLITAIFAIENALGVNPAVSYGTVANRLTTIEANLNSIGNIQVISLAGDLGGTLQNPKTIGIQGAPIANVSPNFNDSLIWNGIAWAPAPAFTAAQDLSGTGSSQQVVGFFGRPLNSAAPIVGQSYVWSGSQWAPASVSSFNAAGDISGTNTSQRVIGINGIPLSSATLSPADGDYLSYQLSSGKWTAIPPTNIFTPGGDVSGSGTSQFIKSISGNNAAGGTVAINANVLQFGSTQNNPTIAQVATAGSANALNIQGQNTTNNNNGGFINITSGNSGGSGAAGGVYIGAGAASGGSPNNIVLATGNEGGLGLFSENGDLGILILSEEMNLFALHGTPIRLGQNPSLGDGYTAISINTLTNAVTLPKLAGNGDGYASIDNTGKISWSNVAGFSAGGDITGTASDQTVIKLQGNPILSQSLGSSQDGYNLTWNNTLGKWEAQVPSGSGFVAHGDLTGTALSQQVVGLVNIPVDSGVLPGQTFQLNQASSQLKSVGMATVINALAFGADPTNATDSTTALQNWLHAVGNTTSSASQAFGYLPPGRYQISKPLVVNNSNQQKCTITGDEGSAQEAILGNGHSIITNEAAFIGPILVVTSENYSNPLHQPQPTFTTIGAFTCLTFLGGELDYNITLTETFAGAILGQAELTFECFIDLASDSGFGGICVCNGNTGSIPHSDGILTLVNGTTFQARLTTSNTPTVTVNATVPLVPGTLQHVAATYDGSFLRVYVDGYFAGHAAATGYVLMHPQSDFMFGPTQEEYPMTGGYALHAIPANIASVRVSNIARYTSEAGGQVYTPSTTQLTGDNNTNLLFNFNNTEQIEAVLFLVGNNWSSACNSGYSNRGLPCYYQFRGYGNGIATQGTAAIIKNLALQNALGEGLNCYLVPEMVIDNLYVLALKGITLHNNCYTSTINNVKISISSEGAIPGNTGLLGLLGQTWGIAVLNTSGLVRVTCIVGVVHGGYCYYMVESGSYYNFSYLICGSGGGTAINSSPGFLYATGAGAANPLTMENQYPSDEGGASAGPSLIYLWGITQFNYRSSIIQYLTSTLYPAVIVDNCGSLSFNSMVYVNLAPEIIKFVTMPLQPVIFDTNGQSDFFTGLDINWFDGYGSLIINDQETFGIHQYDLSNMGYDGILTFSAGIVTLTNLYQGLFSPSLNGGQVTVSNAATSGNNGTFTITSVTNWALTYANASGATDANNRVIGYHISTLGSTTYRLPVNEFLWGTIEITDILGILTATTTIQLPALVGYKRTIINSTAQTLIISDWISHSSISISAGTVAQIICLYRPIAGTVTASNGQAAVTGSSTLFTSQLFVGMTVRFQINSTNVNTALNYQIASITDDTHLTLNPIFQSGINSGPSYTGITMLSPQWIKVS